MKFEILTVRSTMAGYANLAKLADSTKALSREHLQISFAKCGFFDGNMSAALQGVISNIVQRRNTVELIDIPLNIYKLLCKNEFLCQWKQSKIADLNGTTLPYKSFGRQELKQFASYLDMHLPNKGIPEMTAGLGKKFRQSIFEIFQNCVMHSKSDGPIFVCGQFYPKEHHLDLTISDFGVGIRANVRQYLHSEITSVHAIKWAMIEGNTTKTGSQPGGFGLKLLQEFIELNNGIVQIVSGDGFYEFSQGLKNFAVMKNELPGTTINFQINTSDTKRYGLRSESKS